MAMDSGHTSGTKPSTPFEWLSGGLFFGKTSAATKQQQNQQNQQPRGIEGIDASRDVPQLVDGIHSNLDALLRRPSIVSTSLPSSSAAASSSAEMQQQQSIPSPEETEEASEPSKFLAARLARIRCLLYEERTITSAQYGGDSVAASGGAPPSSTPIPRLHRNARKQQSASVAVAAVQTLSATEPAHRREVLPRLLENLPALPFETRKHVAAIFNYLLVSGLEGSDADLYRPCMDAFRAYVESMFERFMDIIVKGHEQVPTSTTTPDVALHFGSMYRSCLRHASLYQELVRSTDRVERFVFPFLDTYVHYSNFEIASDAMESMRVVFLAGSGQDNSSGSAHRAGSADEWAAQQQAMASAAAEFMARDYEAVWDARYNPKLLSSQASYMTRRVALQILSAVLLTRSNYNVMIRYVDSRPNLILIMDLLRDTSPHITLDAWQVFKVFVANPNKPNDVIKILRDNKVKLCRYLESLHRDREENDAQFRDEKALIIATIEAL